MHLCNSSKEYNRSIDRDCVGDSLLLFLATERHRYRDDYLFKRLSGHFMLLCPKTKIAIAGNCIWQTVSRDLYDVAAGLLLDDIGIFNNALQLHCYRADGSLSGIK